MEIRKLIKNFKFAFAKSETHFRENLVAYQKLLEISKDDEKQVLIKLNSSLAGLPHKEIKKRIKLYGYNVVTSEKPISWYSQLWSASKSPFNILLIVLAIVSYLTGDFRAAIVMLFMIALSVLLRFLQEYRSTKAAEKLKALVKVTCDVIRPNGNNMTKHIPLRDLVPGDIVLLNAGDVVPADVRVLESKDLFISQAVLTGESVPVEKHANYLTKQNKETAQNFSLSNICYMGTNVVSGTAKAIVVTTGTETYFGSLASQVVSSEIVTSFDKGINNVSYLLIRFMLIMVPTVFLLNGLTKGDWTEAFLFSISVAVGLTPELLPMIVTTNLAKGAINMSKKKTIVKHLQAIQSFGAMDILCADKTGTLTQDKIVLKYFQDARGNENPKVLEYCFVNSFYQSGLQNILDKSILEHKEFRDTTEKEYKKIDEIPFDFERRKMSVVVQKGNSHVLICKGAAEEIMNSSQKAEVDGKEIKMSHDLKLKVKKMEKDFNEQGFRVVGIAYKKEPADKTRYEKDDENDLVFLGFLAFLDPPKESVAPAIKILSEYGIAIKILTGDNEIVTRKICSEVGLNVDKIILGDEIDKYSDDKLSSLVEDITVFAKLNPMQKARIVDLLRKKNHTVGFLGDGINDAPPLKQADVGISVDTAADIAKESADVILLEKSLLVLKDGIIEGRKTFGNTMKYIKSTASSNFGNVFSVLGSSILLPFLPMRPIHLLIQNLLYDFSQSSIPTDNVDEDYLKVPRKWDAAGIARFMLFIGPASSIFDYLTFALMWFIFHANTVAKSSLFQSGWFIEGLLTQTIIVHMLRTEKIPFFQSRPSIALMVMTVVVMAIGIYLPFSSIGAAVGLRGLPWAYFGYLALILVAYCLLVQVVKKLYIKRFHTWI